MDVLKTAGSGLMAIIALGMAMAGSASAASSLWLLCLEKAAGSGYGRFVESQCRFETLGGVWETSGLPRGGRDTIKIAALSMRLVDLQAGPLKEKAAFACAGSHLGTGEITAPNEAVIPHASLESASCEQAEGPCETNTVNAVSGAGLPWRQTLIGPKQGNAKQTMGTIRANGNATPGWSITCNTILGATTDTCGNAHQTLTLSDVVIEHTSMVQATFEHNTRGTCSLAPESSGPTAEINGALTIAAANETGLAIHTQH